MVCASLQDHIRKRQKRLTRKPDLESGHHIGVYRALKDQRCNRYATEATHAHPSEGPIATRSDNRANPGFKVKDSVAGRTGGAGF